MELEDIITTYEMYDSRDCQARFVYTLRNDVWLEHYVGGEPHRDLSSVTGVSPPTSRPRGIARILAPILV